MCRGGDHPGPSHLGNDRFDDRHRLPRWEFPGDGPARGAAFLPQFTLEVEGVHLHHDAVYFVWERIPLFAGLPVIFDYFLNAGHSMDLRVDRQTPAGEGLQEFVLRAEFYSVDFARSVAEDGE